MDVDMQYQLSKLTGIPVLPGDGKPNALHYMDVALSSKGLFITHAAIRRKTQIIFRKRQNNSLRCVKCNTALTTVAELG